MSIFIGPDKINFHEKLYAMNLINPQKNNLPQQGVSIIVPTLNREKYLLNSLKDLLAQDYSPFEIIVVDQSEEIPTSVRDFCKSNDSTIKFHHSSVKGLPNARNFAWQVAKYENLIYVDDDIKCDSNLIKNYLIGRDIYDAKILVGGIEEPNSNIQKTKKIGHFNKWTGTIHTGFESFENTEVDHVKGCNFFVQKSVLLDINGFDENFNYGSAMHEELDFCFRAKKKGHKIFFIGNARLVHFAATAGGCRVKDMNKYILSLIRNKTIIITHHLNIIFWPTNFIRLALLAASYAKSEKKVSIIFYGFVGFINGLSMIFKKPHCTKLS